MKRTTAILAVLALVFSASCTQKAKVASDSNETDEDVETTCDTISTVRIEKDAEKDGAHCHIGVDYPVCSDKKLQRHLLNYIMEEIDKFCFIDHEPFTLEDQSKEELDTIVGWCAWAMVDILKDEVAENTDEEGMSYFPSGDRMLDLNMLCQAPKYVSYMSQYQEFTGGAHGMYAFIPATIVKSSGKRLTNILRPDKEEDMQSVLWEGLLEGTDDEQYRNDINEYLEYSGRPKDVLPLPENEPWLAPDGVHLQYQPYEICNWAMGAPVIVIPTEKALPFISDEAAKLHNNK